jgi:hypothetical protein
MLEKVQLGMKDATGTEQENSASFEREGGATWASGGGLEGTARTGGAARHAAQRAELRQSGCNGLTWCGVELLVRRSRPVSRARAELNHRQRARLDVREPCQDDPSTRTKLLLGVAGSRGPGPGDLDPQRTDRPHERPAGAAGCSWVGWTSVTTHDTKLTGWRNDSTNSRSATQRQALGGSGGLSFMR